MNHSNEDNKSNEDNREPLESLDRLFYRLGNRREETAQAAIEALAVWPEDIGIPLVRLLTHAEVDVRSRAANVLCRRADVRVLEMLVPLLTDEEPALSLRAREILTRMGEPTPDSLRSHNAAGYRFARKILAQPGLSPQQRSELLHRLQALVPRPWKTRLHFPMGSVPLFCKQMTYSQDTQIKMGAHAVLDFLSLPRASQSSDSISPLSLLRPLTAGRNDQKNIEQKNKEDNEQLLRSANLPNEQHRLGNA